MKTRSLLVIATLALLVLSTGTRADITFRENGSVTVTPLVPLTAAPQFASDTEDGLLVLARNNQSWLIMRAGDNAAQTAGDFQLAANQHHDVLLSDVTGDGRTDLIIATTLTGTGPLQEKTFAVTVELLAGPTFDNPTTLYTYDGIGGLVPFVMQAEDVDNDNAAELILSVPTGQVLDLGQCIKEVLSGETIALEGIGSDTVWSMAKYYADIVGAHVGSESWLIGVGATASRTRCNDATGSIVQSFEPVTLTNDIATIRPFDVCPPTGGGSGELPNQLFGSQHVIDPNPSDASVDVVSIAGCEYADGFTRSLCDPMTLGFVEPTLAVHRLIGPDAAVPVWTQQLSVDGGSAAFHSMTPDRLLVLSGDSIITLLLTSGQVEQTEINLPTGDYRSWIYPDGAESDPQLAVVDNDVVKWYAIDLVTSVEDELNDVALLPHHFTLGDPYPNPFNALVTVPLTVQVRSEVEVAVYDIIGRRVELLHGGTMEAGSVQVEWDAGAHASGIYFIKVSSGGDTRSAKVILLK